jgi:hypothetical protein
MAGRAKYKITICWSSVGRKWYWQCEHDEHCSGVWHPTACGDSDNPGCVKTSALNHADAAHPGDEPVFPEPGECPAEVTHV